MLAALGAGAATGIGAGASAMANARARDELKTDFRDQIARYDRLLNRNYVDAPENAGLMRRVQDLSRDRYNQARATNVVAGGTDAHLASMQEASGKMVSDTGNAIAERAQTYHDKIEDAKYAEKNAYAKQMFGLEQQQAQTIANAAGQATKAMAGIAAAGGTATNPYDLFGLGVPSDPAERAQLAESLQRTLDTLKEQEN